MQCLEMRLGVRDFVLMVSMIVMAGCGGDTGDVPTDLVGDTAGQAGTGDAASGDTAPDTAADAAVSDVDDVGTDDVGTDDVGIEDDIDTTAEPDTSEVGSDTDDDPDEDSTTSNDALADYIRCEARTDCPVGAGDCVRDIAINRGDRETVPVAEVFDDPTLVGVCGRGCTTVGQSACDDLIIEDARGRDVAYTCQLVWEGSSPYPAGLTYPFDAQIDLDEMTAGVPFAALCRPPFELHTSLDNRFCSDCSDDGDCGSGVCWSALDGTSGGPGLCVAPCEAGASGCPLGFDCRELSSEVGAIVGTHCVPVMSTCSDCADRDGDCQGVGRCGDDERRDRTCRGDEPITAVDCDDFDANARWDLSNPLRTFPDFCGEIDLNCNGLSDAAEQIGSDLFGAAHCTACGDLCEGPIEDGFAVRGCRSEGGGMGCVAVCDNPQERADCDGDIDNGCETEVTDPSALYYRDEDGDGRGRPLEPFFACDGRDVPVGYVPIGGDCDDTPTEGANRYGQFERDGELYAALAEVCDGLDNDCNADTPDGAEVVGGSCADEDVSVCVEACVDGMLTCTPVDPEAVERCDGIDNDCDGLLDVDDPDLAADSTLGMACVVEDAVGQCRQGVTVCRGSDGIVCESSYVPVADRPDPDRLDADCDGFDGDLTNGVFVRNFGLALGEDSRCADAVLACRLALEDPEGDYRTALAGVSSECITTDGSERRIGGPQAALNDLQLGIDMATCLQTDVYLATGEYVAVEPIELRDGVGLFGGFGYDATDGDITWIRPDTDALTPRSTIVRVGVDASESVFSAVMGINLVQSRGRLTRLEHLSIRTTDVDTLPVLAGPGIHNVALLCSNCPGLRLSHVRIEAGNGGDARSSTSAAPAGSGGTRGLYTIEAGELSCDGVRVDGGEGADWSVGRGYAAYPRDEGDGGGGAGGASDGNLCNGYANLWGRCTSSWAPSQTYGAGWGASGGRASAAEVGVPTSGIASGFPAWSAEDNSMAFAPGLDSASGAPGGGGGGGGRSCRDPREPYERHANGGGGGSGGCGGRGGAAGAVGGYSVALFFTRDDEAAARAPVLTDAVELVRADGGAGARGQQGGAGGAGGAGNLGSRLGGSVVGTPEAYSWTATCSYQAVPGHYHGGGGGGGAGGNGGAGGTGGNGGGSIGLLSDVSPDVLVTTAGAVTFAHRSGVPTAGAGVGGAGGAGGEGGSPGLGGYGPNFSRLPSWALYLLPELTGRQMERLIADDGQRGAVGPAGLGGCLGPVAAFATPETLAAEACTPGTD